MVEQEDNEWRLTTPNVTTGKIAVVSLCITVPLAYPPALPFCVCVLTVFALSVLVCLFLVPWRAHD